MKTVQQVPPIQLVDKQGSPIPGVEPTTFYTYVDEYLLNDAAFGAGFKATCAGLDVRAAFRMAEQDGESARLDDAAHVILVRTIETPNQVSGKQLTPEARRQYLPFARAILDAAG